DTLPDPMNFPFGRYTYTSVKNHSHGGFLKQAESQTRIPKLVAGQQLWATGRDVSTQSAEGTFLTDRGVPGLPSFSLVMTAGASIFLDLSAHWLPNRRMEEASEDHVDRTEEAPVLSNAPPGTDDWS